MKTTKWFVVALVIFSSFPVLAQQANANAQQTTSTQTHGSQATTSTSGNASATRNGNGAQAQGSAANAFSIVAPKPRAYNKPSASHPQPQRASSSRAAHPSHSNATPKQNALNSNTSGAANGALSATENKTAANAVGTAAGAATTSANGPSNTRPASTPVNPTGTAAALPTTHHPVTGMASGTASPASSAWNPSSANLQPVNGELLSKLDSKSAKPGDQVILKTTQATRTADGTQLPKGTRLIGHVTSVQRHRAKSDDGVLGIAFDHALLKGGRTVPIHSVIESVAPSPAALAMADNGADNMFSDPVGGGMTGGGMIGGGRGIAGGGALAGGGTALASSPARMVNTSAVGNGTGFASAGHNALGSSGNLASGATASANNLRGSAAGSGLMAAHATAVPGVLLAGDATGAASGTLSATRRNVHLGSGTQMVLGVTGMANR